MKRHILTLSIVLLLFAACSSPVTQQLPVPTISPQAEATNSKLSPTATAEPTPPLPPTSTPKPAAAPLSFVDSGQQLGVGRSWDVALGDLDGDGDLDALVANGMGAQPGSQVWLNDGTGQFAPGEGDLGYGMGLDLGDLDGDGDLDCFIASWDEPGRVWFNDGAGRFSNSGQNLGEAGGWDVSLGDLDGDGDLDAFIAQETADTVWINDGAGSFSDTGQQLGQSYSAAVGLGDFDGDGDLDALNVGWNDPGKVWLNDGTGIFTDSGQTLTQGYYHIHGMTLGDLNADGTLDAIMAGVPNEVWINDGSGVFCNSAQNLARSAGDTAAVGDVDGDGDLDIYVAVGDRGTALDAIWLNDGNGVYSDSKITIGAGFTSGVALGDLDGDGDLDAFVTHGELGLSSEGGLPNEVWLNQMP